jgi:hypothetical protein
MIVVLTMALVACTQPAGGSAAPEATPTPAAPDY